ncbi:hypothetical protein BJX61DRAFT_404483 [Aspergillus egyptiacus]|nr:hypothetical protein BJX61DRAFT_404483 [Aspergillus egyptiacus]
MPSTDIYRSPVRDGRRILSEKSANACFSPARSPVKRALFDSASPKKLPSPSFVAQKRSISQVDEDGSTGPRVGTRRDTPLQHMPALAATADRDSRSAPSHDTMNLDEQTECSQQPLRQTETHTRRPSQFVPAGSEPTASALTIPSDPETRKQFIQEKATLLRNRLQNAMRHVRDPQFDRRLSELEAHSRKYPRLSISGPPLPRNREEHLKRKYEVEAGGQKGEEEEVEEEVEEEEKQDEVLHTPRAQLPPSNQDRDEHEHEHHQLDDDDEIITPTQESHTQLQRTVTREASSPTQMLLSSPTYNPNPLATSHLDDDTPR